MLQDHVKEQWQQTAILERIAHLQELDWEGWAIDRSEEEEGMEESRAQDGNGPVDKGKGTERKKQMTGMQMGRRMEMRVGVGTEEQMQKHYSREWKTVVNGTEKVLRKNSIKFLIICFGFFFGVNGSKNGIGM